MGLWLGKGTKTEQCFGTIALKVCRGTATNSVKMNKSICEPFLCGLGISALQGCSSSLTTCSYKGFCGCSHSLLNSRGIGSSVAALPSLLKMNGGCCSQSFRLRTGNKA